MDSMEKYCRVFSRKFQKGFCRTSSSNIFFLKLFWTNHQGFLNIFRSLFRSFTIKNSRDLSINFAKDSFWKSRIRFFINAYIATFFKFFQKSIQEVFRDLFKHSIRQPFLNSFRYFLQKIFMGYLQKILTRTLIFNLT